jgi:hypothetical protein
MEDGTMKEKIIDGISFSVTPFQAVEALRLKAFLIKKFGPSIGQALGALQSGLPLDGIIGDLKLDGAALSQAVEKLMSQLDEDDFIALIKRLFQNVTASLSKDGKALELAFIKDTFDASMEIVFTGRLFSVYEVIALVLEANYPDFFDKVVSPLRAGGIGKKLTKTSTSGKDGTSSGSGQRN